MELLLGCGGSREKRIGLAATEEENRVWDELVTLDINAEHQPDVVWDLNDKPWPFPDDTFDEVHAYEVLEHLGRQGDAEAFFADFSEAWRILKPGGYLMGTSPSPSSPWVWGDPSHTRVIFPESLVFLDQEEYVKQVGNTAMSDFRSIYKADFRIEWSNVQGWTHVFVLQARKPVVA